MKLRVWSLLVLACAASACNGGGEQQEETPSEQPAPVEAQKMTKEIPSGMDGVPPIQVEVLKEGAGEVTGNGKNVRVRYRGTFLDGKEFDKGIFSFRVGIGQAIKGWDLLVAAMRVGDSWKARIPYQLAYGEQGHAAGIPGRTDLMFEMELLEVR